MPINEIMKSQNGRWDVSQHEARNKPPDVKYSLTLQY